MQSDYLATLQSNHIWTSWFRYTSATCQAKLPSFYPECSGRELPRRPKEVLQELSILELSSKKWSA